MALNDLLNEEAAIGMLLLSMARREGRSEYLVRGLLAQLPFIYIYIFRIAGLFSLSRNRACCGVNGDHFCSV